MKNIEGTADVSLTPTQIERLSSPYIAGGLRSDVWQIDSVRLEKGLLHARVSMRSAYASPTDAGGAHLTMFASNEFLSQLMVIYMHHRAGLTEKCREVWAAELHGRYVATIRELSAIDVAMQYVRLREVDSKLYCKAGFVVSAACGGRFEVDVTCIME